MEQDEWLEDFILMRDTIAMLRDSLLLVIDQVDPVDPSDPERQAA